MSEPDSALAPLVSDGFSCTPSFDDRGLTVVFVGSGDINAVGLLSEYLKQLHSAATTRAVSQVSCDFRQLTFMNSSCFKAFVVWIDTVKNAPSGYAIRFVTDPNLHWQRRSLEALRRLAVNTVQIETA